MEANLDALRVLATLDTQNRHATPQEQATLARWSGWGATPAVFDDDNDRYAAARQELRQLVGQSGFDAARRTTLNAHYTDPDTDRAMWSILTSLGFQGGTVLEPGCGAGTFLGTAPVPITATGVELDPTTARIPTNSTRTRKSAMSRLLTQTFRWTPSTPSSAMFPFRT